MAGVFGPQGGPTRINQVRINQSVLGYCLAVVMGKAKIQQAILWTDGFSWKMVSGTTGGAKGLGGKGSQYDYSADVIAGLCNGPISGVDDVWSGQSWLSNTPTAETTTIVSGTPYTPTNASNLAVDLGVTVNNSYSATVTDLGSGGPVTLAGTMATPFKQVAYVAGSTSSQTTGQYSVSPSGEYYFSPADTGKTVTINYSFSLDYIKQQETDLVPSGQTIQVGGALPFYKDGGVIYYDSGGTNPLNGQALAKVNGTPTTTGTYSVSGSAPATYHFAPGDVGQEVQITYQLNNSAAIPQGTPTSLTFTLFEGHLGQTPWALLGTNFSGEELGYTGVAYAAYSPMDLGSGAQIQENTFEVQTPDAYGGGIVDCSPVQCILQVLTNPVWGLGTGAVPFPVSAIDNGTGGTWGSAGTPGAARQDGTAYSWFAANGFFISPVIDRQDTAASLVSKWLEAGQCAAFMSEGLLKLGPYGDTSTAGNGAVWTAPSAFVATLDDSCFIEKGKDVDPVKTSSTPWQDAYNTVQVQWSNRGNQYAPEITPESDQASINRYGSRIEDPQTWDFITTLPAAAFAASMRVKRNVYTRNTYEFTLPWWYATFIEPMDVLYLTTSSFWAAGLNNQNLNMTSLPVRVIKTVDNPDGTFDVTAEDYPFGVHQPTIFNKSTASGTIPPNEYADPGNTEAVLLNATGRLTAYAGNQLWIGATGANDDWGGCNVWASVNGAKYAQIATINSAARLGTLANNFPSGSDPDTTDSLVVDLVENSIALDAASTADADAGQTLCLVGNEVISYSACTSTGQDQYTMNTYLRRGQMGSTVAAASAGAQFLRLDDTVLQYVYDPSWAGQTVYFKFQSFNAYQNSAQDLSTLTAVTFTIAAIATSTIGQAGVTANPTISTTALTDLPELGTSNSAMTVSTDGSHPDQLSVALGFAAANGSGVAGAITSIGIGFSAIYRGSSPPTISITISGGGGSGASAIVQWTSNGTYPSLAYSPQLYIYGGSGYSGTPTATVTITNGGGSYPNGTNTYNCTVGASTPQAGVPVLVQVLMDGTAIVGPVELLSDSNGNIFWSFSKAIFPTLGSHSFEVQAKNLNSSYTVTSTNRSFQFVPLG